MKNRIESFENLVNALEALPSIGKKSAQRMAYHMVMEDHFSAMKIAMRSKRRCRRYDSANDAAP